MALTVEITNLTAVEWYRNNWHVGAGIKEGLNWTDEISQAPSEIIRGGGGTTVAVQSVHLTTVLHDALWVIIGYGRGDDSFAVRLQQLFHMFGQGPQCEWSVWDKQWTNSTTDATKHIWEFKEYRVEATPTLSSDGADVKIFIYDQKKK